MKERALIFSVLFIFVFSCNLIKKSPLNVGFHDWGPYEVLCIANKDGKLKNINITKTSSSSKTMELLKQKKIDAAGLTLDEAIKVLSDGVDLVVVLVFDVSAGADMLIAKKEISHPLHIKGKRIAVEYTGLGALMLSKFLDKYGLKDEDISKVIASVDQHYDLWKKGDVDACISFPPFSDNLIKDGGKIIFDSREIPNTIIDVLVVRREIIEDKADQIKELVKNYFTILDLYFYNSEQFYHEVASCMDMIVDVEDVRESFRKLSIPTLSKNINMLNVNSSLLNNAKYIAMHLKNWGIIRDVEIKDSFISSRFLPVKK